MRIIICGLNGAGKSTLGRALAGPLHFEFRDIEDYYFPKTDDKYEYSVQRTEEEVAALLLKDLYDSEERFFKMVESRSDDHAKGWLKDLTCPVISIDGTAEVATNVEIILNRIAC